MKKKIIIGASISAVIAAVLGIITFISLRNLDKEISMSNIVDVFNTHGY